MSLLGAHAVWPLDFPDTCQERWTRRTSEITYRLPRLIAKWTGKYQGGVKDVVSPSAFRAACPVRECPVRAWFRTDDQGGCEGLSISTLLSAGSVVEAT